MTDLQEKAMRMALDALEIYGAQAPAVKETIEALRQVLAMEKFSEVNQEIEEELKKPEQGRLSEITRQFVGIKEDGSERWVETEYRTATRYEWVGLTDEDLRQAYCEVSGKEWCLGGLANAHTFYEAIESRLKEKNHG